MQHTLHQVPDIALDNVCTCNLAGTSSTQASALQEVLFCQNLYNAML
jgi:hypothetical protein